MEHNKKECIKTLITRAKACKDIADNHITRIEFLLDLTLYVVRDVIDKDDALMAVESVYDKSLGEVFIKQLALYGIEVDQASTLADLTKPIHVCVVYVSSQAADTNAEKLIQTMLPSTTILDVIDALNKADYGEVICGDTVGDVMNVIIRHPLSKIALYKLEVRKTEPAGNHWIHTKGDNIHFACVGKLDRKGLVWQ